MHAFVAKDVVWRREGMPTDWATWRGLICEFRCAPHDGEYDLGV